MTAGPPPGAEGWRAPGRRARLHWSDAVVGGVVYATTWALALLVLTAVPRADQDVPDALPGWIAPVVFFLPQLLAAVLVYLVLVVALGRSPDRLVVPVFAVGGLLALQAMFAVVTGPQVPATAWQWVLSVVVPLAAGAVAGLAVARRLRRRRHAPTPNGRSGSVGDLLP